MACSTPTRVTKTAPAYSPPTQQCTGGRVLVNGQCQCPSDTQWSGTECVTVTPTVYPPTAPSAPQEIAESASGTGYNAQITILWTPGSGATSQDVIDPISGTTFVSGLSGTANEATITGLYAGATVHMAIRAKNSAGSVVGSTTAFVMPCPSGYTATGGGCQANVQTPAMPSAFDCSSYQSADLSTEVDLCWNIDPNVDYYLVRDSYGYGGGMNGPGANVGYTGIAHLTGLPPGTTIQAQVAGVNSAGQGPWSPVVTMTTQQASAAPSQSISAWDCSAGQPSGCIGCCFSGVPSNAAEVMIQHVDANGNLVQPYSTLADYVQGNSAQVCGLYSGATEHWQVQALDDNGNLVAWSNIVASVAQ